MHHPEIRTLHDLLHRRAEETPGHPLYTFLADGERESGHLTCGELGAWSRSVAARLLEVCKPGDRALLLFPFGPELLAAFFGCLQAGVLAVPAYPPRPRRDQRLRAILGDARPAVVLSTRALIAAQLGRMPELEGLPMLAADEAEPAGPAPLPQVASEAPAFLQYTSGSTSTPKGVVVTHANLLHNEEMIRGAFGQDAESVVVGWLPFHHDMGLIGNLLQPLWSGGRSVLMSPTAFLQRPRRWLEAISRYRATTSGGPNFAFELCLEKVENLDGLDLSSWRVAFNGAEPVRAETLARFAARFAACGFPPDAFLPCYGLAEATLLVASGGVGRPFRQAEVDAAALERHQVAAAAPGEASRRLVSSGAVRGGQRLAIVDPESREELPAGSVGEIWVSGPSVAAGYWERPVKTERDFRAVLAGDEEEVFLRTGDLGFLEEGELFVTGRLKDLIILRGRNLYPQDIELTAERSHPALRPGCGAAFAVDGAEGERLVVVHEVERHAPPGDEVAPVLRRAVFAEHEAQVHDVVLLRTGTLPKTTSGKVQRSLTRRLYLEGSMAVVGRSTLGAEAPGEPEAPAAGLPETPGAGLLETLRRTFARAVRAVPERVDLDSPVTALGLDSLSALEWRHSLLQEIGDAPSFEELLEGVSLRSLAGRLGARSGHAGEEGPRPAAVPAGDFPLSWGQRSLWFLHRLAPDSPAYTIAAAAALPRGVDGPALRSALAALVERHPALRTVFADSPAGPVQRVVDSPLTLALEDASPWTPEELEARVQEVAFRPFDLARGPLFRAALFTRTGPEGTPGRDVLVLSVHHIAADFWSLAVLMEELGALYARAVSGEIGAGLAAPALGVSDFVSWQEEMLAGPRGEELWAWWRARLDGVPPLDLPTDRPRPSQQGFRGATRYRYLAPEAAGRARGAAQREGVTLFVWLTAAYQLLLARFAGQEDFVVGAPTAGRSSDLLAGSVGYFVSPVALRVDLSGDPTGSEHLARTRRSVAEAFAHGDFPLALLAERLQPDRGPGRPPLIQTLVTLQQAPWPGLEGLTAFALGLAGGRVVLSGIELESLALTPPGAQFDLSLQAGELPEGLALSLQADTDLFDEATAGRMLGWLETLLEELAADSSRRLRELPWLRAEERHQVLRQGNATQVPELAGVQGLHELFERQAARSPEAVALVFRDERMTYRELERRAEVLAAWLVEHGVGPESPVGVFLERRPDMVAALLGILKAGGAYVPLDPAYPRERLAFLLADSGAALVLAQESLRDLLPESGAAVLEIGSLGDRPAARRAPVDRDRVAYVIYTSGSTGVPKGVEIRHGGAMARVAWARKAYGAGRLRGVLAATSICFDLSVYELFAPLSVGGTVILADNALALPELAARDEVTLVNTVPSAMSELVRAGAVPASVRTVNLAGEPLRRELVDRLYALAGVEEVWNLYGPSEDTTYSTGVRVPRQEEGEPAIGLPLSGSQAYVLDSDGEPVPVGVPGELWLGGAGVARGYRGRPGLTAERFRPDPFGGEAGARLYRTGDRVRRLAGGQLAFLGRLDHQVKVRGFRIEPGEVEAALLREGMAEALVLVRIVSGDAHLVAYVAGPAGSRPDAGELRARLRQRLPEPLVPTLWAVLERLPRLPNGKVDRSALSDPGAGESTGGAARTPLEDLLTGIMADLLGRESVGPDEDFFALGGHSLLAARVVARLRTLAGVELPLAVLFRTPTAAALAPLVEQARSAGRGAGAPPLRRQEAQDDRPLSSAQERLWFLDRLVPGLPVYNIPAGLRLRGPLSVPSLARGLAAIVERHEVLRSVIDGAEVPRQRVVPCQDWRLHQVDLAALAAAEEMEGELRRLAAEEAVQPFDLAAGPLLRATLVRLAPEEHALLLTLHHIASDGVSLRVLARELSALYGGLELVPLPMQYGDYAVWEREWLASGVLEPQIAAWREALAGVPPVLDLPADRPRPELQQYGGAVVPLALGREAAQALRRLSREEGATLFMVLLGGFAALLSRLSGQQDLMLGTPVAHRVREELEGLIGLFVNTLPLRLDLAGDPAGRELLARAREAALAAWERQDVPFERLVEEIRAPRDLSRTPLFQVLLVLQESPATAFRLPGIEASELPVHSGTAKFDLSLMLRETADGIHGELEYATSLFDEATAVRLLGGLEALLAGLAEDPSRPLSELSGLRWDERRQAQVDWSRRAAAQRRDGTGGGTSARSPLEGLVAGVMADLLGRESVAPDEDFFVLGGHSLLAARLVTRLRTLVGVELPLTAPFRAATAARLAEVLEQARRTGTEGAGPRLRPRERGQDDLPLATAQERIWFLERLTPGASVYNIPVGLRLRGELSLAALEGALHRIVERHEALRTVVDGDAPRQRVVPAGTWSPAVVDLAGTAGPEAELARLAASEAAAPFDLERAPLLRATVVSLAPRDHALLLTLHHIAADGASLRVLAAELSVLYNALLAGEPAPALPELPVQYGDCALWEREWLASGALEPQLAWWRERLAGSPPALELPTDRPRPAVQSFRGGVTAVAIDGPTARSLRGLARREGATPFMAVLAGMAALLCRASGEEDVVLGTPVAHRVREEMEGLIGLFVNTLPLRLDLMGDPDGGALLARAREVALAAWTHQDVPFERLVEEVRPGRDLSRSPLFQVLLVMQEEPVSDLRLAGLEAAGLPVHNGTAKFDLTLSMQETAAGFSGELEHAADLFDRPTAERLAGWLESLLASLAADPSRRLSELSWMRAGERRQVLAEWNRTDAEAPEGLGLHGLFEEQAARTPEAVALVWGHERMSYGELERRAEALAARLAALGVGAECRVAVFLERRPELVTALLGILKAEGVYVPLDPAYPRERLAYLLADSGAALVVTQESLRDRLPESGAVVVEIGSESGSGAWPVRRFREPVEESLAAYLIYTSGSTGAPKGVEIRHGSAVRRVVWAREAYGPERLRGVLAATSICFDLSVYELFAPLSTGGAVILAEDALALPELPARGEVTLINTVPSAMSELLRAGAVPASVRTVNLAGEPLRRELADRLYALPGVEEVWNLYGPSEDTTYSTASLVPRSGGAEPAIGLPLPGSRAYVLDGYGEPMPVGVPGELWLGGAGLARGYHGRPELTADRFRPDPFGGEPGARLYRTGDRTRRLVDGQLAFLGRLDQQVKVRGFRIEPGEVEAALAGHPAVREAVVMAREDLPGDRRLVAYWVPEPGPEPAAAELRSHLRRRLPEAMIPSLFVALPALPLTPNGKLDRRALPRPVPEGRESGAAASNPVEETVAAIWSDVLGSPVRGEGSHFFELGGHSLLAVQTLTRVRGQLGADLPLRAFFEAPTLGTFSRRVEEALRDSAGLPRPLLVPAAPGGELPLSFAQQRLWFLDQLEPGIAAYNLPAAIGLSGRLVPAALAAALGEVVARHAMLRTRFASVAGVPVQTVVPARTGSPLPLPLADLAGLPEESAAPEMRRLAAREGGLPFDLAGGPLLRALLLRRSPEEHALLLTLHHIAADGGSIHILASELAALYPAALAGAASPLPPLPLQYGDYAVWQRDWLRGPALEAQLAFWRERLAGAPAALPLPTDHPRPAATGAGGSRSGFQPVLLEPGLAAALATLARSEGATLFMVLLAAWKNLLHRSSGEGDLRVGAPISNRSEAVLEDLIGLFINIVALRTQVDGGSTFRELLARVREGALAAYTHQDLPFERLVEELAPDRDLGRAPFFQVMFNLHDAPLDRVALPGLDLVLLPAESSQSKFDLILSLQRDGDTLGGALEYRLDLFEPETAARLARQIAALLAAAVRDPDAGIGALPLLAPEERQEILRAWNDTATPYPHDACVEGLFEEQVERAPGAVALSFAGSTLTYAALGAAADRLARRLRGLGIGPDVRVAVCAERGSELIVALVAVLKAGGAYVPLDPEYPRERLLFMLADSGAAVVLAQEPWASSFGETGLAVVRLGDAEAGEAGADGLERPWGAWPERLAYVMYTSGSTGRPKGVAVTHRAIVRLVRNTDYVSFAPADRVAQVSNLAFDAATFEIWGALLNGACLVGIERQAVLEPAVLARRLAEEGITTMFLTTALFNQVARHAPKAFAGLRHLLVGGEALDPRWVREVLAQAPPERLLNGYGPTETTTFAAWHRVIEVPEMAVDVPIGRPLANTLLYILDGSFEPVPVRVAGDLYIGGDGVARGYFGRPDLTAERFLPDLWSPQPGARMYRTGDRARFRSGGVVEFLGRLDHQVKIRGFRIEPGEIEAALLEQPGVHGALVTVHEERPGDKRLAAYVAGAAAAADLRQALQRRLPPYMVPASFTVLSAFPLTPNGKVDRRALPAPLESGGRPEGWSTPGSPLEELLAVIWGETLGVVPASLQESFFEMGGHSLLATQMVSRIRAVFGVDLPLRVLFEKPVLADLAREIEEARRLGAGLASVPVAPVPRGPEVRLPLSHAQERLWLLDQLRPGSATYNIPAALRLRGPLDVAAFAASLAASVARHEALRTTFHRGAAGVEQIIGPPVFAGLALIDLSGLPAGLREAEAQRAGLAEAAVPFDLSRGPLLRGTLLRLGSEDHAALLTLHHIVGDGWSMGLLVRELAAFYPALCRREPPALPPLPVQYADFAVWQREWLRGGALEIQLAAWKERLRGSPPLLDLPADRPRPALATGRGAQRPVHLPAGSAAALAEVGRSASATLFMALLAVWDVVLYRLTGETDLVVGTPVAGRNRAETEGLIGCFVNSLPVRVQLSGELPFRRLVDELREILLAAYAHQDVPFERLVEELAPQRSLAHSPVFQVMFALQNTPSQPLHLPGLAAETVERPLPVSRFDLTLGLAPRGGSLAGSLELNRDLFDLATGDRIAAQYVALLSAAAADPACPIGELPWLSREERHQVLEEHNRTAAPVPRSVGLHGLFEEQAERTPDAVALEWRGERMSYRELHRRAEALAHRLVEELGVGPERLVGVFAERHPEMVVALLGVLKAGGTYVPLDPSYPRERLAFLLADSGAPVVVTQRALRERLPAGPAVVELESLGEGAAPRRRPPADEEQLAYLIYTSGSTGVPKGVAIRHGGAVARIAWAREVYGAQRLRRVLASTSICFDLSVFELFAPLSVGGTAVLVDNALALLEPTRAGEVTLVNTVPSAISELERSGALPASVRTVNLAGEPLRRDLVDRLYALPGVEEVWNLYGPSEDTTYSTAVRVPRSAPSGDAEPTIGLPLPNSRAYVLDTLGEPVPLGVPGELWLGGAGLARGYHGRPDLTADRFRPDPFGGEGGQRLYRTGDRVRRLAEGQLAFLGRLDHQVKLRGFRIEPGEIEVALLGHPGVAEAAVVVREDTPGERRLVAYWVPSGVLDPTAAELRSYLRERLPEALVPALLVSLPVLPLTPNGKVDRRALPAPQIGEGRESAPPRSLSPVEELLAGIFSAVLGVDGIGIEESFFDLGGHSLLATQVVSRVRSLFGVELPLHRLFAAPAVAALAEVVADLQGRGGALAAPPLVPVPRGQYLPLSFAQQRLWFLDQLEPGSLSYVLPLAMRLSGRLDATAFSQAVTWIAGRHESLRTTFASMEGEPAQVVGPAVAVPLPRIDLSALPEVVREDEGERLAFEDARLPFDLALGPLIRPALVRLTEEEHLVLGSMHHIVSDGWSMAIFLGELAAFYGAAAGGAPAMLPELPVQYADFAVWQRQWLSGGVLKAEIGYWRQRLEGAPPLLELPLDRPRPAVWSGRGAQAELRLPAEFFARLTACARREVVTPFMLLLTTFQILLHRWSGAPDLCTGSPIAGRNRLEIEGVIGFFINTLVLRADLGGHPTVREALARTREVALEAYVHQDLPFEKLVEELNPERDLSYAPLFQSLFMLQNTPQGEVRVPGLTFSPATRDGQVANFDLTVVLMMRDWGLEGVLTYPTDLFDHATMLRLLARYEILLADLVASPDKAVADLELLAAAERHQAVLEWSDTGPGEVPAPSLHRLFEVQAARTPEAVAIVFEGERITYGELERLSRRLAHRLHAAGAWPGARIALSTEQHPDMVVMMLAALRAGVSYVAIDPELPEARQLQVLEDSAPVLFLTQEARRGSLPAWPAPVVGFDRAAQSGQEAGEEGPLPEVGPQDISYVVYTSGSTGRPKGILTSHGSGVNHLAWVVRHYGINASDAVLQRGRLLSDASIRDVLSPLWAGARLVMVRGAEARDPEVVARKIAEHGVTCILAMVPTLLRRVAQAAAAIPGGLPSLRLVVVSGEVLLGTDVAAMREACGPRLRVFNQYGPTEGTMTCLYQGTAPDERRLGGVEVGRPMSGIQVRLLDSAFHPVPIGAPGEVCLGGAGLTHGYPNLPDRTADVFIPDPFAPRGGERLYRTGDLARHLPDGTLQFLGRIDHQIKLRGIRIEPGEVESALRQHPAVRDAVVVMRQEAGDNQLLCAYLVTSGEIPAAGLRAFLSELLPDSIIPSRFVTLGELPRTATGKVDRRALPDPPDPAAEMPAERPRSAAEELLAGLWQDILGRDRIGLDEDFFEAGGHSLLATQLISRIRQVFAVDLPLRILFQHSTVTELAAAVEQEMQKAQGLRIPPLERTTAGEAPLSFSQQRLWFMDQIQPGSSFYNIFSALQLLGELDAGALRQATARVVQRHEALRTTFVTRGEDPAQIVHPAGLAHLVEIDLQAAGEAREPAEAYRVATEEALRPFDLSRGPLLRCTLLRLAPHRHVFILVMHHIIADAWSAGLFLRELVLSYRAVALGEEAGLPDLPVQYPDFAVWQRSWLRGEVLDHQLAAWKQYLAGAPPLLKLSSANPRPARQSFRGASQLIFLPAGLADRLAAVGRAEGGTLFMVLLAGFQILLHRHSEEVDLVVGSPFAYRNWAEVEGLIGFFASALPLRCNLAGDPAFRELLERARESVLHALTHQNVPFEKLVEELQPKRDLGYNPLFQVTFNLVTNDLISGLSVPGLEVDRFDLADETTQFDLSLTAHSSGSQLAISFQYSTDLFAPLTVTWMAEELRQILEEVVADPGVRLSRLKASLGQADLERRAGLGEDLRRASHTSFRQRQRRAVTIVPESPAPLEVVDHD